MPLTLLDGKTDLLRQVLAWLELRDRKALSAVNRYTARSELRQLVFAQCVLRLPALQSIALPTAATTVTTAGDARRSSSSNAAGKPNGHKKRSSANTPDTAVISEQDTWSTYYGGTFLRQLDAQMAPFIQRVFVPLSMAKQLLAMLQFAPNLQRVGFWNDAVSASAKSKVKQITVMDVGYVCALSTLQTLDLSAIERVHCLDAIESMASLRSLDLSGTNVSDATALGQLRSLEVLNLRRTRVSSLAFVQSLALSLRWLDISDSRVQDFAPLAHARSLEYLNMSRNWVGDVTALRFLSELKTLKLCNSGSLGPLELVLHAPHLTALYVHDTMLSDLAFLLETPRLVLLDVRRTHILPDLGPLAALTELETLLIDDSSVVVDSTVLSPAQLGARSQVNALWASQLTRLKRLQIDQSSGELHEDEHVMFANPIDGAVLVHFPALESLEVPALVDYSPLWFASHALRELELHSWVSEDLRRLAMDPRAATLQSLKLTLPSAADVVDLHPLESFEALTTLVLVDAVFEDLVPLGTLVHLRTLDLSLRSRLKRQLSRKFKHAQDFSSLSALMQLEVLQLEGRVDFQDVAPLAALTALRRLNLQGTKVATLAPLTALRRLESLNVASTPLESAPELQCLLLQCAALEELWIPEKLDCTELQRSSSRLRFLWHREGFNCLWMNHRAQHA